VGWLCSADGHVMEPADLWTSRVPQNLRDRAPRFEYTDTHRVWWAEGKPFIQEPLDIEVRADGSPIIDLDVALRLKELDQDGIWAETLVGNMGSIVTSIRDDKLAFECARAYNDFLAETFGPYDHREIALGVIPVNDVPEAVREIERCLAIGLKGVTLPIVPPTPYFLELYEPVWECVEANGIPLSVHANTGTAPLYNEVTAITAMLPGSDQPVSAGAQDAARTTVTINMGFEAAVFVGHLVGSGVLARHPKLQVVCVETGAGWLAGTMEAMDHSWATFGGDAGHYDLLPSEMVRRQVHVTFQDEPAALKFREFTGIEPLLWGSDYPHAEGTWPHSREVTDRLFAGIPSTEKDAILGGTLARLYAIDVPVD
jgi:predicted TIM-barrel fold metal-dependent hydrolase